MRVQIPAYHDRWMMGDRYGEVVKTWEVSLGAGRSTERASVLLDKSGKKVTVSLHECEVID